jgi:hypothetical protein
MGERENNHQALSEKETGVIIGRLQEKLNNSKLKIKESPWVDMEVLHLHYETAYVLTNSNRKEKYLVVDFGSQKLLIKDYQEEQEKSKDKIRHITINNRRIIGSLMLELNGNIIEDGFVDRRAKREIAPEEINNFLKNGLDKSIIDDAATAKLEKRTPRLSILPNSN